MSDEAVFTWWHDTDHTPLAAAAEWCAAFPQYAILGEADIAPLIDRHLPHHAETYAALNLPSARSDIARLLLLYDCGGLYVDARCGVGDAGAIRALLERPAAIERVFVERTPQAGDQRRFLRNGVIFAKAGDPALLALCAEALAWLAWQRDLESEAPPGTHVPYDVWSLCGPGLLSHTVFDNSGGAGRLRPALQDRIALLPEATSPVRIAAFRSHQPGDRHWSTRQRHERLFTR